MATFTCNDYFLARVPDFPTLMPAYPVPVAIHAAMSLYWDRFIPTYLWDLNLFNILQPPPIDELLLTERQKVVTALRAVIGAVPVFTKAFTVPQIVDAKGGPAEAKFEERSKLYAALLPTWMTELKNLEAFENIFFDLLPSTPAYLQALSDNSIFDPSVGYVFSSGTWFVKATL